jgi:invasion protein IalB
MPRVTQWLLAGAFVLGGGPAYAQGPQRTMATYEEWTVSCTIAPEPSRQKSCEVVQQQTIPGQTNPVSQITISRSIKSGPFKISVQVPANVWLQYGVKLATDDKDLNVTAGFQWCIPARCLADSDVLEGTLKRLSARSEPGRVEYKDALQRDVAITASFKGLAEALDAMAKE